MALTLLDLVFFFFKDPAPTGIYPLSLHDALPISFPAVAAGPFNRRAFAAVHVVADPLSDKDPWVEPAIDWDATIAYRHHLWRLGFAVAEAMDTDRKSTRLNSSHT